ncbi:MAG: transcription termination/antitermination factor NusG [Lentisphaerae bacterium]|nr:transcription termination/antitermination factor NusG [Lentisphaerota bacterium]
MEDLDTAQWYVLQVMSGQENRVQKSLLYACQQNEAEGIENGIIEIVIPTERIEERRSSGRGGKGGKVVRDRKLYPGYVLMKVRLYDEQDQLIPDTWALIKETQGVIGFIGGDQPVPLSDEEVEAMRNQNQDENQPAKPPVDFTVGQSVIIRDNSGAFDNIEASVVSIDRVQQLLKVAVNMFGSMTIVELGFGQVDRP